MNKTKIIATIGPGCDDESTLQELVDLGVCCFRINLSHGSKDQKNRYFDLIRSLRTPLGLRPTILADLAGPKIRVRNLEKPLRIKQGDSIVISNDQVGPGKISEIGRAHV